VKWRGERGMAAGGALEDARPDTRPPIDVRSPSGARVLAMLATDAFGWFKLNQVQLTPTDRAT
jgi:hypothetical protein